MIIPGYLSNDIASELNQAIIAEIVESGYYLPPCEEKARHYVTLDITNTNVEVTGSGNSAYADLNARIVLRIGNSTYYNKYKSISLRRSGSSGWDIPRACRGIARAVIEEITPHAVTYKEKISPNDENPSLELGAKACAAGNWDQGRHYAQQAINAQPNDPEAYYLMGLIERNALNYAQSTYYFEKALSIEAKGKYKAAITKNSSLAKNEEYVRSQLSN